MKKETVNIGDFNELITWMAPTDYKDSMGQTIRSFTAYKTDWAEVSPVSIAETELSNRLQYGETYTFTTHYDAIITNTHQISYEGDDYNILAIQKLNMKIFMRVTATKIVE